MAKPSPQAARAAAYILTKGYNHLVAPVSLVRANKILGDVDGLELTTVEDLEEVRNYFQEKIEELKTQNNRG